MERKPGAPQSIQHEGKFGNRDVSSAKQEEFELVERYIAGTKGAARVKPIENGIRITAITKKPLRGGVVIKSDLDSF